MADNDLVRALRISATTAAFVDACRAIVAAAGGVSYSPAGLERLVPLAARARARGWEWCLRDPRAPLSGRWFDFLFNAALNGGYFACDPLSGEVRQWAVTLPALKGRASPVARLVEGRLA